MRRFLLLALLAALFTTSRVWASDAPAWMHAAVNASLPEHDDKTPAVTLYSEEVLTVQPNGKMKRITRRAYRILRPSGKDYGTVVANFDAETKITSLRAWCIPAQGKDYEVKEKDAYETALRGVANGELATDLRSKILTIPAADPGSVVGYELEQDVRPYVLQDLWDFQEQIPTAEARYTLQLPSGWEYKVSVVNYPEAAPVSSGNNQWQWVIKSIPGIRPEEDMPPWDAMGGLMVVTLQPPGSVQNRGFLNWREMSAWEYRLTQGRRDPSPEIKQRVALLTTNVTTTLAKMQALAKFVQSDIRYVAIELGIGGLLPHPAADIYSHHYGDCKDKATLMSSMLHEIGVDSFYLDVNTERGGAAPDRPAMIGWFNHEILAIKLPPDVTGPSITAVIQHPTLGRLLIFDPTDDYTPFGQIRGPLQANYGLLVSPDAGELLELPLLNPASNGIRRSAKLSVSANGSLSGDFEETRVGDPANEQRSYLRTVTKEADRIKPVETLCSHSLPSFRLTKATILNMNFMDRPFGYNYSLVAEGYAKPAGNLLLVRPRVIGEEASGLLETKEPRKFPVEFEGPRLDSDTFEITLPPGYEADDLPPPVTVDYPFASYHSKSEMKGNVLVYTRTFEIKNVSVSVAQLNDLRKFYRIVASDERNTAVLKPSSAQAAVAPAKTGD